MEISLNQGNRLASLLFEIRLDFSSKNLSPGRGRCGGRGRDGGGEGWGRRKDEGVGRMGEGKERPQNEDGGRRDVCFAQVCQGVTLGGWCLCATSGRKKRIFFFLW